MNTDWVAGAVVVIGLCLGVLGLLIYGIWDVVRQLRGEHISITASSWLAKFFIRHPLAAFCAGLVVGILAGHFMWGQVIHIC